MSRANDNRVEDIWYGDSLLAWLLLPLSGLFALAVTLRQRLYAMGVLKTRTVDAPVIVVGNVTAGGTGKTPVTIWIAKALTHLGYKPGVVSRGYGGTVGAAPVTVTPESDPAQVGDEAIVIAAQCRCPVVVHPDRVAAARQAVASGANVIVSDDGLQHYSLGRDIEVAVVDSARGFGNGWLIPAGPLREPASRLASVDVVMVHRHPGCDVEPVVRRMGGSRPLGFRLRIQAVMRLDDTDVRHIDDFSGRTVHAVAGIGHPERFFSMLESHGISVIRHPLPDHSEITVGDIRFDDDLDVLMTQKDAVKCRRFGQDRCWYVPAEVEFDGADADAFISLLTSRLPRKETGQP